MRSIVISIKSICFSYGWIQLLKLVSLLPVQFSNKRIICSNRKKVLHMLFIRNLYVFRPTVYDDVYVNVTNYVCWKAPIQECKTRKEEVCRELVRKVHTKDTFTQEESSAE